MVLCTHTIEAWRTAIVMGKQTMMHRAALTTPLGTIGTLALYILRVIETLREDTPLGSRGLVVVERDIFLHRPSERAMVNNDILDILYTQRRHTAIGKIASTEAEITKNGVRRQLEPISGNADTTGGSRLTSNCRIGFSCQI